MTSSSMNTIDDDALKNLIEDEDDDDSDAHNIPATCTSSTASDFSPTLVESSSDTDVLENAGSTPFWLSYDDNSNICDNQEISDNAQQAVHVQGTAPSDDGT